MNELNPQGKNAEGQEASYVTMEYGVDITAVLEQARNSRTRAEEITRE